MSAPRLSFYLVVSPPSGNAVTAMAMLPTKLAFPSPSLYCLVAAMTTDAQHAALVAVDPTPSGWHGTLAQAQALLRAADLTHLWWLYDVFIASQGADRGDSLRQL